MVSGHLTECFYTPQVHFRGKRESSVSSEACSAVNLTAVGKVVRQRMCFIQENLPDDGLQVPQSTRLPLTVPL